MRGLGTRPSERLRRERITLEVMMGMYCQEHHGEADLCPGCAALLDYAGRRIDTCRFGDMKPTCARCTVHCFRTAERESIRVVMRYAGPRMLLRHPYLAIRHLLDRRHTPCRV
jgi:hypothetical protein